MLTHFPLLAARQAHRRAPQVAAQGAHVRTPGFGEGGRHSGRRSPYRSAFGGPPGGRRYRRTPISAGSLSFGLRLLGGGQRTLEGGTPEAFRRRASALSPSVGRELFKLLGQGEELNDPEPPFPRRQLHRDLFALPGSQ